MARQATSAPAKGDPNYDAYQAQQAGYAPNDPLYQLTQVGDDNGADPSRRASSQTQIKALRDFFREHNLSRDEQVKVVQAVIERSKDRNEAVSVQETIDLAKETSYTPQEWANERAGVHVEPRPTVSGQGQPAEVAAAKPAATPPTATPAATTSTTPPPAAPAAPAPDTVTQAQWDEMSTVLGYDAQAAWLQHKADFQKAQATTRKWSSFPPPPPNAQQWLGQTQQAMEGQFSSIIDGLASQYAIDHGRPMPAELRNQIRDNLASRPASLQSALIKAMNDSAAVTGTPDLPTTDPNYRAPIASVNWSPGIVASMNLLSGTGSVGADLQTNLVTPYATQHETTGDLAKQAATSLNTIMHTRIDQFIQAFGNRPLPADANNWGNMTQVQFQDFLDNQPYKLGMTKKQYDAAAAQIDVKWQSAFGVPASDATIAWAAGKSADEVTRYIDSQPSRKSGMTVGQYNGVVKAGDTISNDLFGHPMDDHLVSLVWGGISKNNPRAAQAPPPPQLQGTANPPVPATSTLNPSTPTRPDGSGGTLPTAP